MMLQHRKASAAVTATQQLEAVTDVSIVNNITGLLHNTDQTLWH